MPRGKITFDVKIIKMTKCKDDNPLPDDWEHRRECIIERDKFCQMCGQEPIDGIIFSVHHIVPREDGGTHDYDNLILLCDKCHDIAEETLPSRYQILQYFKESPAYAYRKENNNIIDRVLFNNPEILLEIGKAANIRINEFLNITLPRIREESKLIEV